MLRKGRHHRRAGLIGASIALVLAGCLSMGAAITGVKDTWGDNRQEEAKILLALARRPVRIFSGGDLNGLLEA